MSNPYPDTLRGKRSAVAKKNKIKTIWEGCHLWCKNLKQNYGKENSVLINQSWVNILLMSIVSMDAWESSGEVSWETSQCIVLNVVLNCECAVILSFVCVILPSYHACLLEKGLQTKSLTFIQIQSIALCRQSRLFTPLSMSHELWGCLIAWLMSCWMFSLVMPTG